MDTPKESPTPQFQAALKKAIDRAFEEAKNPSPQGVVVPIDDSETDCVVLPISIMPVHVGLMTIECSLPIGVAALLGVQARTPSPIRVDRLDCYVPARKSWDEDLWPESASRLLSLMVDEPVYFNQPFAFDRMNPIVISFAVQDTETPVELALICARLQAMLPDRQLTEALMRLDKLSQEVNDIRLVLQGVTPLDEKLRRRVG